MLNVPYTLHEYPASGGISAEINAFQGAIVNTFIDRGHTYAVEQQARFAVLAAENNAPRAELDRYNDELRRATAEMNISQVAIAKAQTSINVAQAALDVAKADMATAQWRLSRTEIVSPVNGTITNLTTRPGDTATVNIPMIGIVDADAWRIMANYKQYYVRSFEVGGEAWVWLDSAPWGLAVLRCQFAPSLKPLGNSTFG